MIPRVELGNTGQRARGATPSTHTTRSTNTANEVFALPPTATVGTDAFEHLMEAAVVHVFAVDRAELSCGHTLSIRHGEASAYCSWCAQSMNVLTLAA